MYQLKESVFILRLFVTNESDLTKCTENIVPKCDGAIFHGSFVFFNGLGCVMLSQQMSPKSSALLSVLPTLIMSIIDDGLLRNLNR